MSRVRRFSSTEFSSKIRREITQDTAHVLRTTGEEVARMAMRDTIKQNIYNKYTPVQYKRRKEHYGLADPENTVVKVYSGKKTRNFKVDTKSYYSEYNTNNASDYEDFGELKVYYTIGNKAKRTIITKRNNPKGFSSRKIVKTYYDYKGNWELLNKDKTDDLLYLWKDQGLVYNLFDSPNYLRYSRPAHLNETLHKKIVKSASTGLLSKALLERYKRSFPNSQLSQK